MTACHVTRITLGAYRARPRPETPALCGVRYKTSIFATADESLDEVRARVEELAPGSELCEVCADIQDK